MDKTETAFHDLSKKIKKFIEERDWKKYHAPKNISMSIAIEAAELMEHFQWLTLKESEKLLNNPAKRSQIEDELADIAIYVLDICDSYRINLKKIIENKIEKNAAKYPVRLAKGSAAKYTKYLKKR